MQIKKKRAEMDEFVKSFYFDMLLFEYSVVRLDVGYCWVCAIVEFPLTDCEYDRWVAEIINKEKI